jgi:predicted PurR-regulated permease PerM
VRTVTGQVCDGEATLEEIGQLARTALSAEAVDIAIRVGLLALLAYWSWAIIAPFLTILVWSAILAVALYPLFDRLKKWLNRPTFAATLVTLLCVFLVLAPVVWLGFGLLNGVEFLSNRLEAGISIPLPPESVKAWPLIGEQAYRLWTRAVTDIGAQLAQLAPVLKPVSLWLLELASNVLVGLLKFLLSIIVAGFLFCPGPKLVKALAQVMEHILQSRGTEMVQLAGATIRNVSRGVIGVALLQSLFAGAGFLVAGVPAAGLLSFATLVLGIVQIGPAILFLPIIVWSWMTMDTAYAFMFTAYMVPVGLIDNFLRPILMARGLATPMPLIIIGVIGGTIAYGIVGLFFGPIVLSVAWELAVAWMYRDDTASTAQGDSTSPPSSPS